MEFNMLFNVVRELKVTKLFMKSIMAVLFLFLVISCEKKKEESLASTFMEVNSPFLSAVDFTSENEYFLPQNYVSGNMSAWDELRNYQPSNESDESFASCLTNFKFRTKSANTLILGGEENIAKCAAAAMSGSGFSIETYEIKTYVEITCTGIDLSQFDGQEATETVTDQIETVCGNVNHSLLSNSQLITISSYTSNGTTSKSSMIIQSARITATGEACAETFNASQWTRSNGCSYSQKLHYTISPSSVYQGKDSITKITYNDLIGSDTKTDPFYVSGNSDLYLMGWQGNITYLGVETPPNWSLTKEGTTVTGTLSPTQLLGIPEPSHWLSKLLPARLRYGFSGN
jgi:hypothetical protein